MSKNEKNRLVEIKELFIEYIYAFTGYLLVHTINRYTGINVIPLSATLILIISITTPNKYVPIFFSSCLSAVMDYRILTNLGFITISAFFIVLLYRLCSKILNNIGGRPGIIAFIANLFNILIQFLISLSGLYEYDINNFLYDFGLYKNLNIFIYIFGPLLSATSSLMIHIVAERIKEVVKITNRFTVYGIVAAFLSLIMISLKVVYFKEQNRVVYYGNVLAGYINVGCFAGLTVKTRFYEYIKRYYFHHYIIVGFISGWINIGLVGVALLGGRQGFIGFIGNLIYLSILNKFRYKKSKTIVGKKDLEKETVTTQYNSPVEIVIK